MFLKNTFILAQMAVTFIGLALLCWFVEPRVPKEGLWILLKFATYMGKFTSFGMGVLIMLMALLQYTGFHHGKKAKAGPIKEYLFYGGYALLIVAAILIVVAIAAFDGSRKLISVALFGIGPAGVLLIIASFFFSGADSKQGDNQDKNSE